MVPCTSLAIFLKGQQHEIFEFLLFISQVYTTVKGQYHEIFTIRVSLIQNYVTKR